MCAPCRRDPDAWSRRNERGEKAPRPYAVTLPVLPDAQLAALLREEAEKQVGCEASNMI